MQDYDEVLEDMAKRPFTSTNVPYKGVDGEVFEFALKLACQAGNYPFDPMDEDWPLGFRFDLWSYRDSLYRFAFRIDKDCPFVVEVVWDSGHDLPTYSAVRMWAS